MVLKAPKSLKSALSSDGYTIVDIMIVLALLAILLTGAVLAVNPVETRKRGRDEKRLADMTTLERAISEYLLDNEVLPDLPNTTRYSNVLPQGNSGPLEHSSEGWIDAGFSEYVIKLPLDPINDSTYRYTYRHNGNSYELNVLLEYEIELMQDDGGNNSGYYEVGDNLTIL